MTARNKLTVGEPFDKGMVQDHLDSPRLTIIDRGPMGFSTGNLNVRFIDLENLVDQRPMRPYTNQRKTKLTLSISENPQNGYTRRVGSQGE